MSQAPEPAPVAGAGRCRLRLARAGFELDAALEFAAPGITGVFGASGCGKTSLLRCIAGLEPRSRGFLEVEGVCWQDDTRGIFLPAHRRRAGFVFQEPRLFPHLDVTGNLDYAWRRRGTVAGADRAQVIEWLHLGALLARDTHTLSGGERQRVAIGRALLSAPRLLLLDEPLTATDAPRREEILPYLERLHAHLALPVIYVSHNLDELLRLSDRLAVMAQGRVLACAAPEDLLARADLPGLDGEAAGCLLAGEIRSYDAGYDLSRVQLGEHELIVPGWHGQPGERLRLRILAREVSLSLQPPGESSVRNVLPVRVASITPGADAFALVGVEAGALYFTARVTRSSVDRLGLHPGQAVYAQIKAAGVRSALPALR